MFHTFPMIHIGTKEYYETISNLLNDVNIVLLEGVPFKRSAEIGKYDKTAKLFGLYTQRNCLKIPEDLRTLNIDIDPAVFEKEYRKISYSAGINILKYSIALYTLNKSKARAELNTYFGYTQEQSIQLINPENHYSYKHDKSPFDLLVSNTRDEYIKQKFLEFISNNKNREYRYDAGIVFGDRHMPMFYNVLKELGYKWKMKYKVDVF